MVSYIILFAIWQGTFKSDWYTLYNINVAVAVSLETTYGTLATRLYRAFRPRPLKSSSPSVLRRVCCVPSAYLYIFR